MVRALGLAPETGGSAFKDVKTSDWFCGYVKTASAYGIINGYGAGTFGPNDLITREQAMTMIARAMKLTGLEADLADGETGSLVGAYADGASVTDYARDGVAKCLKTGVVSGTSGKAVAPKDYVSRAEVAVMVRRLLQKSGLI